ncbi:hypothetical protein LLT7_00475 [Lactococcus cremoris subsp. cremoris TIFN7]|nr:hypothetical protein LLT7_00475 [Lactococcus cremoris subsp. cremoris TIFN7]
MSHSEQMIENQFIQILSEKENQLFEKKWVRIRKVFYRCNS